MSDAQHKLDKMVLAYNDSNERANNSPLLKHKKSNSQFQREDILILRIKKLERNLKAEIENNTIIIDNLKQEITQLTSENHELNLLIMRYMK